MFVFTVSDIKDPSEDYDGEQNVEDFWDSVQMEMICRGFVPSKHNLLKCYYHSNYLKLFFILGTQI